MRATPSLKGDNLRSWDMVVREMLKVTQWLGGEPAC
jgi:hypothetical protein